MKIPLNPIKYTVAVGNFIQFILWASFEFYLIIMLVMAIIGNKKSTDEWLYVKTSPIVFYLAVTKFSGFYGALDQNVAYLIIHIVLNSIYFLAIALSLIHWLILGEEYYCKPNLIQKMLSVVYHFINVILFILAIILVIKLKQTPETNKVQNGFQHKETDYAKKRINQITGSIESTGNQVFQRLIPKK